MAGSPEYAEHAGGSLWPTLVGMPRVLARYLRLVVAPWPLCADYSGVFDFSGAWTWQTVASWALMMAFAAGLVWVLRAHRLAGYGLIWFVISLAPESNVIALPVPAAERFLYLPLVGIAIAVAAGASALVGRLSSRRRDLAVLTALALALALGAATVLRHAAWHDNGTLWRQTARDFPRSWGARHGLGVVRKDDGDLDGAAHELETALALGPTRAARASIEADLGIVYGMQGRLDESLAILRTSVQHRPLAKNYFNLGVTLARRGDRAGATEAFAAAIQHDPYYPKPYALLATLRQESGDIAAARDLLRRAAALDPHDAELAQRLQALDRPR
jgi:tetratricopeptide (TPR) repeat protein